MGWFLKHKHPQKRCLFKKIKYCIRETLNLVVEIVSSQANIRNMIFDQRSPHPPEVGVSQCHRHKNRHTDIADSRLNRPRGRFRVKVLGCKKEINCNSVYRVLSRLIPSASTGKSPGMLFAVLWRDPPGQAGAGGPCGSSSAVRQCAVCSVGLHRCTAGASGQQGRSLKVMNAVLAKPVQCSAKLFREAIW